jgi:hypothetical protein
MHFPNTKNMDEDEAQEFMCLMLEGYSEADAKRMARAANDKINSRRLSGPLTGDTRNGRGQRPLISDLGQGAYYEHVRSLGCDDRDMYLREDDWEAEAEKLEAVEQIRGLCTPRQWEFLANKYGFDGVEPAQSMRELADRMGWTEGTANKALGKLRVSLSKKGLYELA